MQEKLENFISRKPIKYGAVDSINFSILRAVEFPFEKIEVAQKQKNNSLSAIQGVQDIKSYLE
jgi:hypothetical protein